jgi:hypothetical protein
MSILLAGADKFLRYQLVILATTVALAQDPHLVKARYRRGMARKGLNLLKAAISGKHQ